VTSNRGRTIVPQLLEKAISYSLFTSYSLPIHAFTLPVQSDERELAPHEATALAINFEKEQHTYFDQHMEWNLPWQVGNCQGIGRLYHSEIYK
jgi:hypothetical protein